MPTRIDVFRVCAGSAAKTATSSPTCDAERSSAGPSTRASRITTSHFDEDFESSRTWQALEAAVERAVNGGTNGIVSWKIDPLRVRRGAGLRDLRRLRHERPRLAFIIEDVGRVQADGKFVYTMLMLADADLPRRRRAGDDEARRLSASVKISRPRTAASRDSMSSRPIDADRHRKHRRTTQRALRTSTTQFHRSAVRRLTVTLLESSRAPA